MKAVRLVITGMVQGVGYRAWAVRQASALGLRGWVRNRADGSVDILAGGEPERVDAFIAACRFGPRWSRVREVKVEPGEEPLPDGFEQRETV
ncbi:acylphosphatase [Zavarzinia sp. CC-PAN008]|uniref:acylphosphatase n=1 Tax=Zavarzinia sp. CC-PAN008 TaxID=3243332 RepID=UPI003F74A405